MFSVKASPEFRLVDHHRIQVQNRTMSYRLSCIPRLCLGNASGGSPTLDYSSWKPILQPIRERGLISEPGIGFLPAIAEEYPYKPPPVESQWSRQ